MTEPRAQDASDIEKKAAPPASEAELIARRHTALGLGPLDPASDPRPWGLALSGGGIRSATFALGVLQSLAKAKLFGQNPALPLLARFDYLSTVSGGGYVGAFFGALFRPQTVRGSTTPSSAQTTPVPAGQTPLELSKSAYQRLQVDPPGRMTSSTNNEDDKDDYPLRWLRENGRYMAPSGAGDMFFAACLQIRNWLAIQYVAGISLLALFLLGLTFRAWSQTGHNAASLQSLAQLAESSMQPDSANSIWWSPWFWVAAAILVLAAIPAGVSYWLTFRTKPSDSYMTRFVMHPVTAVVVLLGCVVSTALLALERGLDESFVGGFAWVAGTIAIAVLMFAISAYKGNVSIQRFTLTSWVATSLKWVSIFTLLGLVESLSQSIYLLIHRASVSPELTLSSIAGAIAASIPLLRKLMVTLGSSKSGGGRFRVPLGTLLAPVAALLILLLAVAWHLLALTLFFGGRDAWGLMTDSYPTMVLAGYAKSNYIYLLALLGTAFVAAGVAGYFTGFLNLSSLATLYSARLTRTFLGASNTARFDKTTRENNLHDVAEPHSKDDFTTENYYNQHHLGPLHLINVTINNTVGQGDSLTQQDRKGIPMVVTPLGVSVNGDKPFPFAPPKNSNQPTAENLTIGQWIGISGAAFSPGIGRGTTPGLAAVCTLANVRLGYWWRSAKMRNSPGEFFNALIQNQRYLLRELTARFYGDSRHYWYLSDGGHFENTGVYELLRRRCAVVVTCDDGADPEYQFEDLANLIRLARIDFGAEFTLLTAGEAITAFAKAGLSLGYAAKSCIASPMEQLRVLPGTGTHCAFAYRISYERHPSEKPTLLLVLKPRLTEAAPLDLKQYQATHPAFPQESTMDQFFDEAQWESYRKLGAINGERLFGS